LSNWFKSLFGRRPAESLPPPALEPPPSPAEDTPPVRPSRVDFVSILEADGVETEQRSKVIRAQELLRTLPSDAPGPVKREIVEAAFKAFDISTEEIITAASSELKALEAFISKGEEHKQQTLADGADRIAELEGKITEVRTSMARAVAEQETRTRATRDEMLKVRPVLQFFTREPDALEPSKEAVSAPRPRKGAQTDGLDVQWESSQDVV